MKSYHRDYVRQQVFDRDSGLCVFCGNPGVDAHHILERRLWDDGGYDVDNLVTVCEDCHMKCEVGLFTPGNCREAAGIENVVVPSHMYIDQVYDKWGNPQFNDAINVFGIGPLFYDDSFQKLLNENWLAHNIYLSRVKYPRTFHLPWSFPNRDDVSLVDTSTFEGKEVVVTEKLDGENTTLYTDYLHARSLDGRSHPSQSWVRNFHAQIAYDIPRGMHVCGENLYAQHSIKYEDLNTYFYGFSVWNHLTCLSWDDTLEWFSLLGIEPVAELYRGQWDESLVRGIALGLTLDKQEGYVVRLASEFEYRDFSKSVGKFVRQHHLQTPERWNRHIVNKNVLAAR